MFPLTTNSLLTHEQILTPLELVNTHEVVQLCPYVANINNYCHFIDFIDSEVLLNERVVQTTLFNGNEFDLMLVANTLFKNARYLNDDEANAIESAFIKSSTLTSNRPNRF